MEALFKSQTNNISRNPMKTSTMMFVFLFVLITALSSKEDSGQKQEIDALKAEIAALKKEVKNLDGQLDKTDSLKREEQTRFMAMKENNSRDLKRRRSEAEKLKEKLNSTRKQIRVAAAERNRHQNAAANIEAQKKALIRLLMAECESFALKIQQTVPLEREQRLQRIGVLKRELASGNVTVEEGFNRLNALYNEEIEFGDKIAMYRKPITRNNGDVVNAQILKLGNQWMVYMDEEEQYYGILQRKMEAGKISYTWKESLDFKEREAIRKAFDIKTAKTPPTLVALPLSLAIDSTLARKAVSK